MSFQYQLIREKIPDLYKQTNTRYEETFIRQAKKVILEEAGKYTAPQYWEDRSKIGLDILDKLNVTLQQTFAVVTGF